MHILVGDVDNGGGKACGGLGHSGNLCLSLSFVVNLKLLLKSLYKTRKICHSCNEKHVTKIYSPK